MPTTAPRAGWSLATASPRTGRAGKCIRPGPKWWSALIQEIGGEEVRTLLGPGEYALNPPGVWHTADVPEAATGLFITAGEGTQHRPR